jgi:hypothetical protein
MRDSIRFRFLAILALLAAAALVSRTPALWHEHSEGDFAHTHATGVGWPVAESQSVPARQNEITSSDAQRAPRSADGAHIHPHRHTHGGHTHSAGGHGRRAATTPLGSETVDTHQAPASSHHESWGHLHFSVFGFQVTLNWPATGAARNRSRTADSRTAPRIDAEQRPSVTPSGQGGPATPVIAPAPEPTVSVHVSFDWGPVPGQVRAGSLAAGWRGRDRGSNCWHFTRAQPPTPPPRSVVHGSL